MHGNSTATEKAEQRGGRAAAVGNQQSGATGGGGPPRVRTVPLGEASKGVAGTDGFVEVKSAAKAREATGGSAADAGAGSSAASGSADAPQRQPSGVDGGDAHMQVDAREADEGGDEEWPEEDQEATEQELRGYWEAAKELLAYAKRQGYPPEHPVRRNAEQQVAEALAQ